MEKSNLLLLHKLEMASPSPNKSEQRERGIKRFPVEKRSVAGDAIRLSDLSCRTPQHQRSYTEHGASDGLS